MTGTPLLDAKGLTVDFTRGPNLPFVTQRQLRAVDGISLAIEPGKIVGVVGESGSGKSTLARALLRLLPLHTGSIRWLSQEIGDLPEDRLSELRRGAQIVFQDPTASLNPRMTLAQSISEPLRNFERSLSQSTLKERAAEAMRRVGLPLQLMNRYPHEISGGQCQRAGIARAMILEPKLLICDEAVSALDVSVQAQIIALLRELQQANGMALLFISHDLAVVRHLCQRVIVMYMGREVESAPTASLFGNPRHPYTQALLQASPLPDPREARSRARASLPGEAPSLLSPPSGCYFRTRCPHASDVCAQSVPTPKAMADNHSTACHHAG